MAFEDWQTTAGTQNFFYKNITKTDASGNVYVAGATLNGAGDTDILLAKYSPNGVQLWIQQYAGAGNGADFAAGLVVTTTDVYVTGAVTTGTASPTTDAITMRYNAAGVLQWATTYNGTGNLYDAGKHLVLDGSGNVYITGGTYNTAGNTDFLTIKYSSAGVQQWVSTYDYTSNLDDVAIKIVANGPSLILTGAVTNSASNYKFASLQLSQSTGSVTGTNISAAITTVSVDAVADLATDASGNIYVVGSNYVTGQGSNYYVQKMNSSLVTAWTYTYNGASSLDDVCRAVMVDATGNVFITGYSTITGQGRNIATMKLNSSGALQWTQLYNDAYNGDDEAADMVLDASSNVYITGYNTNSLNKKDYYTIKYNSSGAKQWDIISDGVSLNDNATNITLDVSNNVIVTGQSEYSSSNFNFLTVRYVQKDIITPTDFNGETPSNNFLYYPNLGQLRSTSLTPIPNVLYHTNNTYPTFYFKENSQSIVFSKINTNGTGNDTLQQIDITFSQALTNAQTYPMNQQRNGYLNYFLNYTGASGVIGVYGNQQLVTPNIYNNIDLMCSSNQNGIKYYFIVKPGGDPKNIKLDFSGATSFSLNSTTNALTINSKIGSLMFDRPTVYQLSATNTTLAVTGWSADWQLNGASNKYKFNTGVYTTSLTLIIEVDQGNSLFSPSTSIQNINWSTYIGKANDDAINKVKTDINKNLFAVGETYSNIFPGTFGTSVYSSLLGGTMDGFISKCDPLGVLLWTTYVGGAAKDNLVDIAFQSNGDLYCVGNTNSNDFPIVSKTGADNDATFHGPVTGSASWQSDGVIFQLKQDGLNLVWSRYYGGSDLDYLRACTMDNFDNFFITGYSKSPNISVVYPAGAYNQNNIPVGTAPNTHKGIIARFNSSSAKTWATYIGATSVFGAFSYPNSYLQDIELAPPTDGATLPDIYITGYVSGNDYPIVSTTGSSNYSSHANDLYEGVVSRFTNNGIIVWSTYFGGTGDDIGIALASGNDKVYITGETNSTDFLSINSGLDYTQSFGGANDALFLAINSANKITHSTPIGGSDSENGKDIIYDGSSDVVYLTGIVSGSNFPIPTSNPINTYNHNYNGFNDSYLCALKHNKTSILWATYLGGSYDEVYGGSGGADSDYHISICHDGNSKLYLGGVTNTAQTATNPFPLDNGAGVPYFNGIISGASDATITRFNLVPVTVVGVKENIQTYNDLYIYPNPTNHLLFINTNTKLEQADYKIYNTMGQIVLFGKLNAEFNSINIEILNTGFYVIELVGKNNTYSAKFIKND